MPEYTQNYEIVAHLQGLINCYETMAAVGLSTAHIYRSVNRDLKELIEKIMPKEDKVKV